MRGHRLLPRAHLVAAAMAAILLLAAGIRLVGLERPIWLDEYTTLEVISAQRYSSQGVVRVLGRLPLSRALLGIWSLADAVGLDKPLVQSASILASLRRFEHPPLYFLLLKGWSLFSAQLPFLRLFSVVLSLGTLLVVAGWCRRESAAAGLLAALLFATTPVVLWYSQEIRSYALLLFCTALAFWYASRIGAEPEVRRHYWGLSLALTAAVLTHVISPILVTSVCLYLLLSLPDRRRILAPRFLVALAVPTAVYAVFYFFFLTIVSRAEWWAPNLTLDQVVTVAREVSGWDALIGPLAAVQDSVPRLATPYTVAVVLLAAAGSMGLVVWGDWRRGGRYLAAAALYWLQLLAYSWLVKPVLLDRSALPGLVPFLAWVGVQGATIRKRGVRAAVAAGLVLLSLGYTTQWLTGLAGAGFERWDLLGKYFLDQRSHGDLVVFYPSYAEGPFRYYVPSLPAEQALQVPVDGDANELLDRLGGLPPGDVFLVVRHDSSVDKAPQSYRRLMDGLRSSYGSPETSVVVGTLSLTRYGRD